MGKFKRRCRLITALLIFFTAHAYAQQPPYSLDDDLIYRINFGRVDDIKILLDKGANPNAVSNTGEYAISVAIGRDDEQSAAIVKALLDKGANPNVYDRSGLYPIVSAVLNNKPEIVTDLIDKNADYHIKSPSGRTLLEIARENHDQDIIKILQAKFDKEKELADRERSPEKFKGIVYRYVFDSCAYQYWHFVLGSRQESDRDKEIQGKIDQVKSDLSNLVQQLQTYYPKTPQEDLKRVSDGAAKKIFGILDAMISNSNRRSQGVGSADDANSRCKKIADDVEVDFAPSTMK